MTHRLLPVAEWVRLEGTELGTVWHQLSPKTTNVLVVEDDKGDIVGCWAFVYVLHAEGVWVAPEHRGRSVVARHLLRGMRNYADVAGERAVWTGANDPAIAAILNGLGATLVPFDSYTIPLVKGES